jgi:membrane fusion protein (multidrug efflux system)
VVELDPIRVVFSVADRDVVSLRQSTGQEQAKVKQLFVPRLRLSNGSAYGQPGSIEFVDNRVDPNTGTLAVWARFDNPQALLLPGQFVNVTVRAAEPDRRPVVPVTAVQQDKQGKFVLVVGPDDVTQERRIAATRQSGQDWIVDSGLQPGELVIVQGLQKARAGAPVQATRAPPEQPPEQATSAGGAR